MKYVLLIHWDEEAGLGRSPSEQQAEMAAHGAFRQALGARLLAGERLRPVGETRVVIAKGGKSSVKDGPFAETREVLGGYYVIDARDADEAAEWAARCPSAKHGTIEVRPIWTA